MPLPRPLLTWCVQNSPARLKLLSPSATVMAATVRPLSSAMAGVQAASSSAVGTRKATPCTSLRTTGTRTPRLMSASAAAPAAAEAAIPARGGNSAVCDGGR